jgi:hypothetical protein
MDLRDMLAAKHIELRRQLDQDLLRLRLIESRIDGIENTEPPDAFDLRTKTLQPTPWIFHRFTCAEPAHAFHIVAEIAKIVAKAAEPARPPPTSTSKPESSSAKCPPQPASLSPTAHHCGHPPWRASRPSPESGSACPSSPPPSTPASAAGLPRTTQRSAGLYESCSSRSRTRTRDSNRSSRSNSPSARAHGGSSPHERPAQDPTAPGTCGAPPGNSRNPRVRRIREPNPR